MQPKSIQTYFKEINKYPLLTKEEEDIYILKAQFGDSKARDVLINSNLRFVITVAKKFLIQQVELEDLIQEGNIGLIRSIEKFDPKKQVKFLSYAVWWIKQGIYAFLNEHSRTIRLSLNQIRDNNKYQKEKDILITVSETENVSPDGFNYTEHVPVFLDMPINEMSLIEVIKNEDAPSPDQQLIVESLKAEVTEMLNSLSDRECEILKLYYGIDYDRAYTLDEIGEKLKLTRERIRQIKELTLNRLSLKSRFKTLIRYLE